MSKSVVCDFKAGLGINAITNVFQTLCILSSSKLEKETFIRKRNIRFLSQLITYDITGRILAETSFCVYVYVSVQAQSKQDQRWRKILLSN